MPIRSARGAITVRRLGFGTLALALAIVACDSTTSSPETSGESPSAAAAQPSGAPSAPAGSEGTGVDFSNAATALSALDSYMFSVRIQSSNTQAGQADVREGTTTMSGTVINVPEKASSLHLVTADVAGTVTDETEIVQVGPSVYLRSGGATGSWQEIPAAQAGAFTELMDSFRPEQMFALYFAPIGTDSMFVGQETRNGVASSHYRGGEDVGAILGSISGVQGSWSSDIWLAQAGGYLVASQAGVQGSDANGGGSFAIEVNITNVNSATPVTRPI
jgi:hypothetical protein